MYRVSREHASAISAVKRGLADIAVDLHFENDPSMHGRYGPEGRRLWRTETLARISHLVEAIACNRPEFYGGHVAWAAEALRARGASEADIQGHVLALCTCLSKELPDAVAARLSPFCQAATAAIADPPDHEHSLIEATAKDSTLSRLFLLHLLQRDQQAAANIAADALRGGLPLLDVYERIMAPALCEIGRMWHMQEASIADEHFCSAAMRSIITQLRGSVPAPPADGRRVLCCTVGGNFHDAGIRMVADVLEMDGWTVEFLGADVPAHEVVMSIVDSASDERRAFHLVAASASTLLSVRAAMDLADAMNAYPEAQHVPLLVGGGVFNADDGLAEAIGATAAAGSLSAAVAVAASLVPAPGASKPH
jgi:methanogenic corrinoid protein MtbC1